MQITNTADLAFSAPDIEKATSQKKKFGNVENAPHSIIPSSSNHGDGPRDSELFQDTRVELERKGMEVSFLLDPSSGKAQMVIVDSGTGREVLKVPSDSALFQVLSRKTHNSI